MSKKKIVAISSCAAGIAHTYMAQAKLLEAAAKLNFEIKVETRGATTENELTELDIKNADIVIIASDVKVELEPFASKRVWIVDTNAAIKDSIKVIKDAFLNAEVYYNLVKTKNSSKFSMKKTKISTAIMTAIGYMIPITVVGGILLAIPSALSIQNGQSGNYPNDFTEALAQFGVAGLRLLGPIFAMFLANAIGGKPAIPAGLIGGFVISDSNIMSKFSPVPIPVGMDPSAANAGFLGGMAVGFAAGFIVLALTQINWPKSLKAVAGLIFIPLISSFLVFTITIYVIGGPITWLISQLYIGLEVLSNTAEWANVFVAMAFAGLMCFDFGGPINKTTLLVATAIWTDSLVQGSPNFVPYTAVHIAIAIPPLGTWFAVTFFPHKYDEQLKNAANAGLPMAFLGISEGVLPFAFKNPIKTIFASIVGAMFAGAISALGNFQFYGGIASPIAAWAGIVSNSGAGFYWFFTVLAGGLISGIIFGLITKTNYEVLEEYQANLIQSKMELAELGYTSYWEIFGYKSKKFFANFWTGIKKGANPKNWFVRRE